MATTKATAKTAKAEAEPVPAPIPAQATAVNGTVVRQGARALRFTYQTVTVKEWLTECGVYDAKTGKVTLANIPEAAYQRGREPYTVEKKRQQLVHVLGGGVFPALTVWRQGSKVKEIVNGLQRTHSFTVITQALLALAADKDAEIAPAVVTAMETLASKHGEPPITLEELWETPVTLEILPEDTSYGVREELFIKRGTTEIAIKVDHLADLAQRSLLELIAKWNVTVATSKARTTAGGGRGKASTVEGYKSMLVIEAVHARLSGNAAVSKAKATNPDDNAKLMKDMAGIEDEIGRDISLIFGPMLAELHAKYDGSWPQIKAESSTVISAIAAALGYARASVTDQTVVDAHLKSFGELLKGSHPDPLLIATSDGMLSFYNLSTNNGAKKRDLLYNGFCELFEKGPQSPSIPVRWELAAKKAGIQV